MVITIHDGDWAELRLAVDAADRSSAARRDIHQAIDSVLGVLATLAGERARWVPDNAPIDDHTRCERLTQTLRTLHDLRRRCGDLSLLDKLSQLFCAVCRKLAARSSVGLSEIYAGLAAGVLPPAIAAPSGFWSRRPGLEGRSPGAHRPWRTPLPTVGSVSADRLH